MGSVAAELKSEREKRKISLAQIAADTRISLRHLESLEEGRFKDLPGGMYNRAFLRAYCESLNLDQREIIQRYEAEISPLSEKALKPKVHIPPQSSSIKLSPLAIWSLMLLISATGVFLSRKWISAIFSPYFSHAPASTVRFKEEPVPPQEVQPSREQPVVPQTAGSAILPSSAVPDSMPAQSPVSTSVPSTSQQTAIPATVPPAAKETAPAPSPSTAKIRLEISAEEKCWISVDRDGSPVFRRLMEPGEVQSLGADEKFFVIVGNAAGVHLKVNGKAAKPLGKQGEVIKLLINEQTLQDLIDKTPG